ncbi:MAG TPA: plastocyanin/azurin family copper-binding protein, partial [Terriglobales bacterium]|nr:plastocyanin/azurin family copper-binding protein [Terriglobales bacterium]
MSASSATAATKHVQVGEIFFKDIESNTINPAITTINVGDTVEWDWIGGTTGGTHSTTSGSCPGGICSPDGIWGSPVQFEGSFSYTFNTAGTFTYYCIPHGSEMTGTVIVTSDFTVSISDPTGGNVGGPIFPSQETMFDGNVVATSGFNNPISLSCQPGATALPSPCSPSPASAPPGFSFTITAGANTPGHYSFAAQGTGGGLTHSFPNLNFDVVDFGIAAPSPSSVTAFSQPASTSTSSSTTVTLTAVGSLPDLVTLACEPNTLPGGSMGGASCNFAPPGPYSPTASVPITVSVSIINVPAATPAQDYNVLLDAFSDTNAGGVTKTQPLTLQVVQFAAFTPGTITIGAGNISNAATTHFTGSANFTGSVALACTAGLPPGGACSFSPAIVSSLPSSPSVTASVPFNTPVQSPTLTVTATGNSGGTSAMQTQSLTLNVPAPDFSLGTPSPATVNMVNNSFSQPVTVLLTPTNLAGTVTPSCGSLPTGVSCIFSPPTFVNVKGQPTSFGVIFAANGATASSYAGITINADVTINGTPISHNVALTQLNITTPGTSTTITSSLAAVNSVTNAALINVGDPNLAISATVNNSGSTYSAAVW